MRQYISISATYKLKNKDKKKRVDWYKYAIYEMKPKEGRL